MRLIRRRLVAVAATVGALAVAAPVSAAGAQIAPIGFPITPGGFAAVAGLGVGPSQGCAQVPVIGVSVGQLAAAGGGSLQQACNAALVFIGPTIGNVSSVIGPTIIGAVVLAPVTASTGGPNIATAGVP